MKSVTSDYVVDPTTHTNLGFRGLNGSASPWWWICHHGVYFFFLSTYILIYLLTCTGRSAAHSNIVNGSNHVFSRKAGPI